MTTNVTIIGDALKEINVISEIETPSAEQGQSALRILNRMLEGWNEKGIELGYYEQSSTTDTIPIPKWAEEGVTLMLARRLAPSYGASLTPELMINSDDAYRTIVRKAMNEKLQPADMDHINLGEGLIRGRYNINTDS